MSPFLFFLCIKLTARSLDVNEIGNSSLLSRLVEEIVVSLKENEIFLKFDFFRRKKFVVVTILLFDRKIRSLIFEEVTKALDYRRCSNRRRNRYRSTQCHVETIIFLDNDANVRTIDEEIRIILYRSLSIEYFEETNLDGE